jgi:hypothetical protein
MSPEEFEKIEIGDTINFKKESESTEQEKVIGRFVGLFSNKKGLIIAAPLYRGDPISDLETIPGTLEKDPNFDFEKRYIRLVYCRDVVSYTSKRARLHDSPPQTNKDGIIDFLFGKDPYHHDKERGDESPFEYI